MNKNHSLPHRRTRTLVALAASLTLVAAACGDDDTSEAADTSAADSTETTAATEELAEEPAEEQTEDTAAETTAAPAEEAPAETETADEIDRSDWPDSLVMGAVPAEESTALEESYEKLLEVLTEDLGIEIEFFQATDYAGIIEGQVAGRVDLAQYGPFSYVIARNAGANIEPVGALVDAPDEVPGYQSYGIAAGDNADITGLADFAGRQTCFVDPGSTSGFLYPSAGLIAEGIDPETGVTPVFAGGHDASVISVNNGDCEVGFAFDAMVNNILIESGDIAEGDVKVVWESEVIAGSPIAINLDLPQSLVDEVRRIVLEESNTDQLIARGICEDVETCGLTDENAWGWVPVEDSLYDGVREVCLQTKAAQCES